MAKPMIYDYNSWVSRKDLINQLYVVEERSQCQVLEVLKSPPYNMHATPAQFERILADVLKLSKNLKGEEWASIKYHTEKRKREHGKDTTVYIGGRAQCPKRVRRQTTRNKARLPPQSMASPTLPRGVMLQTPPTSPMPTTNTINANQTGAEQGLITNSGFAHKYPDDISEWLLPIAMPNNYNTVHPQMPEIVFEPFEFPGWQDLSSDRNPNLRNQYHSQSFDICLPIFVDRYSQLSVGLSWFKFADWIAPMLERFSRAQSLPVDLELIEQRSDTAVVETIKHLMGFDENGSSEVQSASRFLSGILPQRYDSELAVKLRQPVNLMQYRGQIVEVLLALSANDQLSEMSWQGRNEIRKLITGIPVTLLEMVIQRNDAVAVAVTHQLLYWSIECQFLDDFELLLSARIDERYFSGAHGGQLLLRSLRNGKSDIVNHILAHKPSPHEADDDGNTVLHLAVRNSQAVDTITALVNQGANVLLENSEGETPLDIALAARDVDATRVLLTHYDLDDIIGSIEAASTIPTFEICDLLWKEFPAISTKLTSYHLIYCAGLGNDTFKNQVTVISQYYDSVKPILELAFRTAVEILQDDDSWYKIWSYFDHVAWAKGDGQLTMLRPKKIEILERFLDFSLECILPPSTCGIHVKLDIVRRVVQNGARIDCQDEDDCNFTALHYAVEHGQLESVRYLIDSGAKVNGWLQKPEKSLYELCVGRCGVACDWPLEEDEDEELKNRTAIWKLLLNSGAEVTGSVPEHNIRNFEDSLARAMLLWDPESKLVNAMMKTPGTRLGRSILIAGEGPFSALQLAIRYECELQFVRNLVANGADINEPAGDFGGKTALQLAIHQLQTFDDPKDSRGELIFYLLENGADANALAARRKGKTALQTACEIRNMSFNLIHLLLRHQADVNGLPAEVAGRTALQCACMRDKINFDLIHLLLNYGADVNAPAAPDEGVTALQAAAIKGNVELVLCLLEKGARVDAPAAVVNGRNAIEAAAEHGRLTVVEILLNAYDAVGITPNLEKAIQLAKQELKPGVVMVLEDYRKRQTAYSGW